MNAEPPDYAPTPFATELERWFDMSGDAPVFRKGKHVGQSIKDVMRMNPGYLDWMLTGADNLAQEVKDVAQNALLGLYR